MVSEKKSPNLDALRAFAVLCVLLGHLFALWTKLGFTRDFHLSGLGHAGVLAFFVHTSYVLMLSLDRLALRPRLVTVRFYLSRIMRIYPLAVAVVVMMLLLHIPASPWVTPKYAMPNARTCWANLLLVQDVLRTRSIPLPLWSIPFELRMYLVLPVCWWLARSKHAMAKLSALMFATGALGWIIVRDLKYETIFTYIPCFLGGVLAYALSRAQLIRATLASALWPFAAMTWFALMARVLSSGLGFRFQMLCSWIMCAALGISIGLFHDSEFRLWNSVTHSVAKYSYGIYLLHTPAMYFVFFKLGVPNPVLAAAAWIALTFAGSFVAYHALEHPCIQLGKRWGDLLSRKREDKTMAAAAGST